MFNKENLTTTAMTSTSFNVGLSENARNSSKWVTHNIHILGLWRRSFSSLCAERVGESYRIKAEFYFGSLNRFVPIAMKGEMHGRKSKEKQAQRRACASCYLIRFCHFGSFLWMWFLFDYFAIVIGISSAVQSRNEIFIGTSSPPCTSVCMC